LQLLESAQPGALPEDEDYLLLERDLLDQQIIDVHGHKVVRVNDVDLVWEPSETDSAVVSLRIAEVEVGLRGAVRRLLKGLPPTVVERLTFGLNPSVIPWDFVDLIGRDPARRSVKLTIEQDRLSQMHPSDIADILEDLAPAERHALFLSLDEEVAAEALEEVKPKMQQSLIEALDSEQIAGIVEEMDPGAAADLLSELTDERSEAILGEMDPEERQEVEDLLEFSGNSAAGRMTTEYVALPITAVAVDAVEAIRNFEGDNETITDIYLLDEEQRISAVVHLVQILLAAPSTPLADLPHTHLVSCNIDANGRKVAELFDKYNLRSLPVLDHDKRLIGVVHAEQVIALLRAEH
jgi:CBS domain-containing protein